MISDIFNSTTKFRHNPVLKHCIKGNQPVSGSDITRWNSGQIRYLVIHLIGLPKPADCTNKNGDCKNLRIMRVTHAGGARPVVCSDRYKPASGGVEPQCKRRSFDQHKAQGWRSHKHLSQQQAHLLRADKGQPFSSFFFSLFHKPCLPQRDRIGWQGRNTTNFNPVILVQRILICSNRPELQPLSSRFLGRLVFLMPLPMVVSSIQRSSISVWTAGEGLFSWQKIWPADNLQAF